MTLQAIKCTDFRCLRSVELKPDPGNNLIYGANASGKTSILEAIAYLGRGRSFRGASTSDLIRYGNDEFVLFGRSDTGVREASLGVRNSRAGLEIHVDGEKAAGAAALAELLPLQVIDPDVHDLVSGGPELRRRYIDWVAFHVEHGYLDVWRRYRRTLKQRNAALKHAGQGGGLAGWDKELAGAGQELHAARGRVLDIIGPALQEAGEGLLGSSVCIGYQRGWPAEKTLQESLAAAVEREQQLGSTQVGPHRADLRLIYDERQARKRVSRGQQKLLACALILAAVEIVQDHLQKPLLLLLDDPAAELDSDSLSRLMIAVGNLGCQVIATSLEPNDGLFADGAKLFHVEHGVISATD
ncbi:MAG: DNA replication and repair protein RecF [Woeseiaceae bacterium]